MITYPLNNIDYTAEDAELFHCTRTSGIWAEDSFPISVTGSDNNITVGKGIAWINNEEFSGKVAALKSAEILDLGIADSVYSRIDVIAIQFNANNNATDIIIKKGTPATNPVRPAIVRSGAVYELYLASVYRPAGATAIAASNITDLRMDETVCGLMADSVTRIDMTAIEAQVRSFINNLQNELDEVKNLSGLMFETEWTEGDVIPVSKGGTGADNAADARTNLGLGNVSTENTVPVSKGGTGKTTHTTNSVLTGNGTNAVKNVASANGAFYATGANGAPKFGTLPVAQGGTGKTSAAEALAALGGISIKKLWENARPTSEFAAQTISLGDVSSCDMFILISKVSTSISRLMFSLVKKDYSSDMQGMTSITSESYAIMYLTRQWRVNSNGNFVVEAAGTRQSTTIKNPNNAYSIPLILYGIKGVQ